MIYGAVIAYEVVVINSCYLYHNYKKEIYYEQAIHNGKYKKIIILKITFYLICNDLNSRIFCWFDTKTYITWHLHLENIFTISN